MTCDLIPGEGANEVHLHVMVKHPYPIGTKPCERVGSALRLLVFDDGPNSAISSASTVSATDHGSSLDPEAASRPNASNTTKEITERAIDMGLLTPQGKAPHATMSAALYRAVHEEQGIVKLEMPGEIRARRGSVRWALPAT